MTDRFTLATAAIDAEMSEEMSIVTQIVLLLLLKITSVHAIKIAAVDPKMTRIDFLEGAFPYHTGKRTLTKGECKINIKW